MKQLINEIKRMQQLAGILKEAESATPSSITVKLTDLGKKRFAEIIKGVGGMDTFSTGDFLEKDKGYTLPADRSIQVAVWEDLNREKYEVRLSYLPDQNEIGWVIKPAWKQGGTGSHSKFGKFEVGQTDDRGYFKIIDIK